MPKSKKTRVSESEQAWISRKIRHLIKTEGKTPKQAAGQAYGTVEQKHKKKRSKKHA